MPLTPEKRRRGRAEAAVATGRLDFKPRAPRKRTFEEMQARTEDAETRARRLSELLEQSLSEIAHQKNLASLWRIRACALEKELRELDPAGITGKVRASYDTRPQ